MGINDSIRGLCEGVQASPEFSKLKQAKALIAKNPGLKREMEEFNAVQKQLYTKKMSTADAEAKVKQLNAKYEGLSKIPEVQVYLKTLEEFDRMMSRIYSAIGDSLEKNLQ